MWAVPGDQKARRPDSAVMAARSRLSNWPGRSRRAGFYWALNLTNNYQAFGVIGTTATGESWKSRDCIAFAEPRPGWGRVACGDYLFANPLLKVGNGNRWRMCWLVDFHLFNVKLELNVGVWSGWHVKCWPNVMPSRRAVWLRSPQHGGLSISWSPEAATARSAVAASGEREDDHIDYQHKLTDKSSTHREGVSTNTASLKCELRTHRCQ